MGAYREQLLRETYGNKARSFTEPEGGEPSGSLAVFKLKFTVSLLLFAGFAYLSMTGSSFCNVTAEQIVKAVAEESLFVQLSELGLYEQQEP